MRCPSSMSVTSISRVPTSRSAAAMPAGPAPTRTTRPWRSSSGEELLKPTSRSCSRDLAKPADDDLCQGLVSLIEIVIGAVEQDDGGSAARRCVGQFVGALLRLDQPIGRALHDEG